MVGVSDVTLSYWVDPDFRERRLANNATYISVEEKRASDRRYYAKHSEKIRERASAWKKVNKDRVNATVSMRDKRLKDATPPWQTPEQKQQIKDLYLRAKQTGMEVDHIHPLKGDNFCGLHVVWNLQLLSPEENRTKSNRLL